MYASKDLMRGAFDNILASAIKCFLLNFETAKWVCIERRAARARGITIKPEVIQ